MSRRSTKRISRQGNEPGTSDMRTSIFTGEVAGFRLLGLGMESANRRCSPYPKSGLRALPTKLS